MNTVITETPSPETHNQTETQRLKPRAFLRQVRITSLGINDIAQLKTRALSKKIKKTGEELDLKRQNKRADLTENDIKKADTETHSPEDSILSNIVEFNQQLRRLRLGSLRVLDDTRARFVEDAIARGEKIKSAKTPAKKGSTKAKASSKSKDKVNDEKRSDENGRVVVAFSKVQKFSSGAYDLVLERAEALLEEAKSNGRAVDFEHRRELEIQRRQRRLKRGAFISRLGMVSRTDWEQLNQRFCQLALEIENQTEAENNSILERRKQERRNNLSEINYDLRLFSRRETDRKVA